MRWPGRVPTAAWSSRRSPTHARSATARAGSAARTRRDAPSSPIASRMNLDAIDWEPVGRELDDLGVARLPGVLDARECDETSALYENTARFRKRVVMERLRFGAGEYQ